MGHPPVLSAINEFLNEYLRINAVRRMLAVVELRRIEILGLVFYAAMIALFEGIGLSLLLPILQYAEGGQAAIVESSGPIWSLLAALMSFLRLPATLPVLLLLAFVPILMRQAVFYLNAWYSAVVSSRIAIRLRMRTVDAILSADTDYFTRHSTGHLVGVVMTQTSIAGNAVLAVMRQLSTALLMLLYIAILLALSVPLTAAALAFALLVSLLVRQSIRRIREYGVETTRVTQALMGKIVERFGMMPLIKLRDQKTAESARIEGYSETLREISVRQARLGAGIEVTADPMLMLSVFVTLYLGIGLLGMTLAQLGLLLFILTRLNAKVKEFNAGRQAISANMAGLLLVQETTESATAANTIQRGAATFESLQNQIVFSGVSFEYPSTAPHDGLPATDCTRVLHEITLTIPAGSLTAIVGRSGSGKSTLLELLPRLRDTTTGLITYDGVDIKQFDVGTLRKGIGYLTQTALLFNDTVRENLTYGLDHSPSESQLRSALERSYATFVYDLPDGLETRLGDRGIRFSGGERQRIALARVLLEDTSILILDEPTSALDSESEAFIQKALTALHGEKTIIVVAHRLATVIKADQLLVIENGRVVESGTHTELIANDGAYRQLFESQLLA